MLARLIAACLLLAACGEGPPAPLQPRPPRPADDVGQPFNPGMSLLVDSGTFMMGCNPAIVKPCDTDEEPYHAVRMSAYEIDRTEVTQGAYQRCMEADVCSLPADASLWDPIDTPSHPVLGVTWHQASAFCAWQGRRLPSEAEWERAARGTDGQVWPWGSEIPDCTRANLHMCGGAPRPVGTYPMGASRIGALDMAGNAVEWVADWYDADAYAQYAAGTLDPRGPATGIARVLRGGGYLSDERSVRASYRGLFAPDGALPTVGFRCARSVETTPGVD